MWPPYLLRCAHCGQMLTGEKLNYLTKCTLNDSSDLHISKKHEFLFKLVITTINAKYFKTNALVCLVFASLIYPRNIFQTFINDKT